MGVGGMGGHMKMEEEVGVTRRQAQGHMEHLGWRRQEGHH